MICLEMENSQLPLVRSASGAHDAWSRLEGHFEKKSLANKLFLRRRFFTAKMDEGDDVRKQINKMNTGGTTRRDGCSGQRRRPGHHASRELKQVVCVPHHSIGVKI